jgi:uncharacterized protein YebE (UPF0316 family)
MLALLDSRKFWAALVGVVAVIAEVYGKTFSQDELVGLILIVVSYMVAIAINPTVDGSKIAETLKSRRFWAALVGIVVLAANVFGLKLPLVPENMIEIALVLSGYIVSVGFEGKYKNEISALLLGKQ